MSEFESHGQPNDKETRSAENALTAFSKLQGSLESALVEFQTQGTDGALIHPGNPAEYPLFPPTIAGQIEIPKVLRQRMLRNYQSALPLTEATMAIIEADLDPEKLDRRFVKSKLSRALSPYGLSVDDGSWSKYTEEEIAKLLKTGYDFFNANYPVTRYGLFYERLARKDKKHTESRRALNDTEADSEPVLRRRLLTSNPKDPTGDFIPYNEWKDSPHMHRFADVASKAEELAAVYIHTLPDDPNWPGMVRGERIGYGDNKFQLRQIGSLASATWDIIRDGTYPVPSLSVTSPLHLAIEVGHAIDAYDLHITV